MKQLLSTGFVPRVLGLTLVLGMGALNLTGCASKTADVAANAPVDTQAAAAAAQAGAAHQEASAAERAASEARGKAAVEQAQKTSDQP